MLLNILTRQTKFFKEVKWGLLKSLIQPNRLKLGHYFNIQAKSI